MRTLLRSHQGCRGCGGGGMGAQPRQVRFRHGGAVTVEERPGLLSLTDEESNGCSGADAGSTRFAHEQGCVYATFVVLPDAIVRTAERSKRSIRKEPLGSGQAFRVGSGWCPICGDICCSALWRSQGDSLATDLKEVRQA